MIRIIHILPPSLFQFAVSESASSDTFSFKCNRISNFDCFQGFFLVFLKFRVEIN